MWVLSRHFVPGLLERNCGMSLNICTIAVILCSCGFIEYPFSVAKKQRNPNPSSFKFTKAYGAALKLLLEM